MSDALLTDCPSCGASTFRKQLTAAGFQLKGSGWYVTDFKGAAAGAGASSDVKADTAPAPSADGAKSETKAEPKADTKAASVPETKAASKPDAKPASGGGGAAAAPG